MKDAFYFSHDSNARNDPKIISAISVYGVSAYAWFFMIIEMLREQSDYKLSKNKYIWNTIAMQVYSDASTIEKFVSDCCNEFFDNHGSLLCMDEKNIWSESLIRRMESRDDVRAKRQKAANIRWNKNKDANAEHDVMHEECISNAIKERKERKEKNNIYTPEFEVFYSEYPRPEDKRRSFNNWKACLKSYTVDQLMTACRNYKKAKAGKQIEFIKSSANFLGKEKPFEDFLNTKTPESKYIDRTGYEPR